MREIKFRAWDKTNDCWATHRLPLVSGVHCAEFITEFPNASLEVMQYTGLKDKNDVEIYEGDILRLDCKEHPDIIRSIFWGNDFGGWMLTKCLKGNWPIENHIDTKHSNGLEIIGNIYQNPELIRREE